jgi:hypothetical protein
MAANGVVNGLTLAMARKIKTSRDVIFLDQCVSRLVNSPIEKQPDNQQAIDVFSS